MPDRVNLGAVFPASGGAFAVHSVVKTNIMDFMPFVKAAQHFQRADLAAARSGMKIIGFHPEYFHAGMSAKHQLK